MAIHDEAARWAMARAEGLSPEQRERFEAWLAADERHATALEEAEITARLLGELRPAAGEAPLRRRRLAPLVAFGAAFAAAAAIAWLFVLRTPPEVAETVRIAASERPVQQVLSDGSVVSLNSLGRAAVELTPSKRRVVLEGEGYFQVAPQAARPFTVEAGDWMVTAVGTAFRVSTEAGGRARVVVTEGVVAIARRGGLEARRVAAGETASMDAAAQAPVVTAAAVEEMRPGIAWRAGVETFEGVTLGALVERFNRQGRVRLTIVDEELRARKVGGTFSTENLEAFLALIQQDGEISVERVSAGEIRFRAVRD